MLFWNHGWQVPWVHGHVERNRGKPKQVPSHFKHEKSKFPKGGMTAKWQAHRAI